MKNHSRRKSSKPRQGGAKSGVKCSLPSKPIFEATSFPARPLDESVIKRTRYQQPHSFICTFLSSRRLSSFPRGRHDQLASRLSAGKAPTAERPVKLRGNLGDVTYFRASEAGRPLVLVIKGSSWP